jgi:phage/plasmid-associated DNA primase
MVAEFLEDNGYPQIKDAWDDGDDAADALPGKMATDGQKADASELAKELKDELKNVFSAAEREYREFAKKHEYLFFGPLGSGYVQELMEDDTWKSFSDRWKRQRADFDELLRERTVAASKDKIFEVSLEGLTDDDKEELYERLLGPCQELLRAWNEFKDFSNDPYWALESREQLKSILDALR